MAYWDPKQGWQVLSYSTDYKTNYTTVDPLALYPYKTVNDFFVEAPYKTITDFETLFPYKTAEEIAAGFTPKTADDFLDLFPNKTDQDFVDQYPANRPTTITFWTKIDSDGNRQISWTEPNKPANWNQKSITYQGTLKQQFSDGFRNSLSDNQKDLLLAKIAELNTNNTSNLNDIDARTIAVNTYNQQQALLRDQQANTYNTEEQQAGQQTLAEYNQQQDQRRQEALTTFNQNQDTLRQQLASIYNQGQDTLRATAQSNNLTAADINQKNLQLNQKNQILNEWSQEVVNYLQGSKTGTPDNPAYVSTRDGLPTQKLSNLLSQGLITQNEYDTYVNTAKSGFKAYYLIDRLSPWNPKEGLQPPTGVFNSLYYRTQTGDIGNSVDQRFNAALQNDDLDILGRFDRDLYAHYHYTTVGNKLGARGNDVDDARLVQKYAEFLTDADYQLYRDRVLGVGDQSLLGEQVSQLTTEGEQQKEKMFGAMTLDALKESLQALQNAKAQEQQFDLYAQLDGFKEITTLNQDISASILGDFGAGGIMGWMGGQEDTEEKFSKELGKITGIPSRSTAVYNWQKWFDEQLTTKYKEGTTFQDLEDPTKTYVLDKEFADKYINTYLKPRFDASKSMSEFTSYLDVSQAEQNIFQTQSSISALKDIADLRAKAYLDQIYRQSNTQKSNFDPEFYLNPTGNFSADDPKLAKYAEQKTKVDSDYQLAKANPNTIVEGIGKTWAQLAYQYGLDINDPLQFARLHYEVVGGPKYNFDGARDVLTFQDANQYIQNTILPQILEEKNNLGDVTFMNFVTPESFADELLRGVNPETNKEEWNKLLESQGLTGSDAGIDEVRQYIIDSFRTNAAQQIRESIKYLNEKRLRPTQERLGVDYIERTGDAATTGSPEETELYKVFRNAGYQGTEDDFYNTFMTDIDRGEMELFTQGSKAGGIQLGGSYSGLTSGDPFESMASMESLFDTAKETKTTEDKQAPSYFRLFDEEDTDDDYKSATGQKILGEFTSMFKGFS